MSIPTGGPVPGDVNLNETGIPADATEEEAAEITEDLQQLHEAVTAGRSGSPEAM